MDDLESSPLATVGVSSMNRYGLLFVFIIGVLGNSFNVYIFGLPHLRQNTCILCLLISSCLNLITLIFGVFLRCLISYNIDLTYNSSMFCKIRYYLIYVSQSASLWLIVFACIDRYLSSSLNMIHRRWMTRRKTYRIIFCILLFSLLGYIEVFYCIDASVATDRFCQSQGQVCWFIDAVNFFIFNSLLPPSLMLGFGAGMLMNIKQSRQRVGYIQSYTGIINRRDKQLISMLLLQVALVVLCMFPVTTMKLYLSITHLATKSNEQMDREDFVYQATISFSYINLSGMFFIYTLRGKLFRDELIRLFHRFYYHQNIFRQRIAHITGIHQTERF